MSPEPFDGTAARVPGIAFPLAKEWQWEYDYSDHPLHSSLLHETYLHGSVLLGKGKPGRTGPWWWPGRNAARCGGSETDAPRPTPMHHMISKQATS
ncbi:hypothetical protein ACIQCJ_02035 [Streptomyces sp. NPDC093221]|uniref:hypothetical protein n=1 Tax=Streptomyces sp. NPDC093221 TaxID=3366032 RepID=UPI0038094DA1